MLRLVAVISVIGMIKSDKYIDILRRRVFAELNQIAPDGYSFSSTRSCHLPRVQKSEDFSE